jgi:hypothetical protein
MLRNISLLLSLLLPVCLYGQSDTVFLKGNHPNFYISDKENANYYRLPSEPAGDRYKVKYYAIDHRICIEAHTKYKDSIVFDGSFISYDSNGKKEEYGNYILGRKVGQWQRRYTDINKLWFFANYYLTGDTSYFLTSYYRSGKVKRKQYQIRDSIYGIRYDENGNEIDFTPFIQMPDCEYDPVEFVYSNLKYPQTARRDYLQGRVYISFVIGLDGKLNEIAPMFDAETALAKEGVRVVKMMPPWRPGLIDDEPTETYYVFPMNFILK